MTAKKKLVILSDNIGLNFSGGAIATCRIFGTIQHQFEQIILIGQQLGEHPFNHYQFLEWKTKEQALEHIKSIPANEAVFYGDFFMADYFTFLHVPFFFTYHDNWPDQQQFGKANELLATFYIPIYQRIFSKAIHVATVSKFKLDYVKQFTNKTSLIRNGINMKASKQKTKEIKGNEPVNILMLGNIDDRKYGLALDVFQQLKPLGIEGLNIHIYGHQQHTRLSEQLQQFPFVTLKGFQRSIDFSDYHLLLMTSKMENLSISVCDALANHTPVICFDVGGLNEVISHKQNGWLVPTGNILEMATVLKHITQGTISFNFESQDLSDFDWELAGQHYLKLFNQYQ